MTGWRLAATSRHQILSHRDHMHCPVDDSPLVVASYEGYPIHRCPQCLGVSVSGSLLREVRAYTSLELHKGRGDKSLTRPCPSDGTLMRRLEYKGIPLCACPQCIRLWLDAGTLSRLLNVVTQPRQEDLNRIGQNRPEMGNSAGLSDLDGLGDILDLAGGVFDAIGNLTD